MTSGVKWPAQLAEYVGQLVVGMRRGTVKLDGQRASVRLRANGPANQDLEINGVKVSKAVRAALLVVRAGEVPTLELELALASGVDADGTAYVKLTDATRELLAKAGWAPPADHHALVTAAKEAVQAGAGIEFPVAIAEPWQNLANLLAQLNKEEAVRSGE